ncbi:unnamed protein product [Calypogeia fissa]
MRGRVLNTFSERKDDVTEACSNCKAAGLAFRSFCDDGVLHDGCLKALPFAELRVKKAERESEATDKQLSEECSTSKDTRNPVLDTDHGPCSSSPAEERAGEETGSFFGARGCKG